MNTGDLISKFALRFHSTLPLAREVTRKLIEIIIEALIRRERVTLLGIGTLTVMTWRGRPRVKFRASEKLLRKLRS